MKGTINLLPQLSALIAIQLDRRAGQAPIGSMDDRHHHNRRLLPRGGQRRQQPPLSLRPANPQMFPAPIQLMKLKLHRPAPQPFPQLSLPHPRSGLFRASEEVCPELSWNQYDKP
jgi:hypothetical protein